MSLFAKLIYFKQCLVNGQLDFVGQHRAYNIMLYGIWISGIIGFIHGFIEQQFLITYYWIGGSSLIVCAICIPSWPFFLLDKVQWLPTKPEEGDAGDVGDADDAGDAAEGKDPHAEDKKKKKKGKKVHSH
eukprot:GEMP01051813.1.p1 GENE.GEMP01051813.1~~GEMP01051813.1.p1  ORF type:complete len:130 (+),score=15.21 GEMP01051813.1:140-529(+)